MGPYPLTGYRAHVIIYVSSEEKYILANHVSDSKTSPSFRDWGYFSSGAASQGRCLFRHISQSCSSPFGKSTGFIPNLHLMTTAFIIRGLIYGKI